MQIRLIDLNTLNDITDSNYLNIYYKVNVEENESTYTNLIGNNKEILLELQYSTSKETDLKFSGNKYLPIDFDSNDTNCKEILFQTLTSEILTHYNELKFTNSNIITFKVNTYNEKNDPYLNNPVITFNITNKLLNI